MELEDDKFVREIETYECNVQETSNKTELIIIIKSPRASRRIRPAHSQTNTRFLGYIPTLPPCLVSLSLSTVPLQVVFGLPLALRPSGVHPNAVKQSFSPSLLSTCLNQFHLLLRTSQRISLIPAISSTLLFVILCCHVIFIIRVRH